MANEFIIKNGFHSKGDSETSGSLKVSGSRFDVEAAVGETKYISTPTYFYKETYNPSGVDIFSTADANSPLIIQGSTHFITGDSEIRQSDLFNGVVTNYSYCSITPSAALLIHRHSGSSAGADSGFVSNDAGLTIVNMHSSPKGLEYFADYSATYVSRSLVDKEYVDDYVAASASADNIATADLTFDAAHTADINGYGWQLKDSTGANRILLDFQQGFGSTHGIGYGGAAIANQHTFYNIGGTNQLCSFSNLNGLKLTGDNGDYLNFGSAGFLLTVKPSTSYGALIGVYPDVTLRAKHSSYGIIFDTNNYVSFKKNTVQHSLIDSSSRWILKGSAVIGSEKISLQDDTLIKGSDNSVNTSGFKVTDINDNSLLEVKNSGRFATNGSNVNSAFNVAYDGTSNNSFTVGVGNIIQHALNAQSYTIRNTAGTQDLFKFNIQSGVSKFVLTTAANAEFFRVSNDGNSFLSANLTLGQSAPVTGARFLIRNYGTNVSQQSFFGNITMNTAGRVGSSGLFGTTQKGFECFDTTTNKKHVWNGTAWEQIISSTTGIIPSLNISNTDLTFDANHYADLSTFSWTLGGTAPIGSEKISLQKDTLIKGSDTSASTTGFKVTDSADVSLLDIKNNGKVDFNSTDTFSINNGTKSIGVSNWVTHTQWDINNGSNAWTLLSANASTTFNQDEFGISFNGSAVVPFRIFGGDKIALGNVSKSNLDTGYSVNVNNGLSILNGNLKINTGGLLDIQTKTGQTIKTGASTYPTLFFNNGSINRFIGHADSSSSTFASGDFVIARQGTSAPHILINSSNKILIGGGLAPIGSEDISLQGDTLISKKLDLSTTTDGFLMPRLTTAQMNAISSPDTDLLVFNTDLDCVMRYNGTAWTTFDSPKYIVRSGGTNTPYSDFKTAVDDAPAGAVLEVHTSEVIDVGMPSTYWDWTKDLTIQTNGHDVIMTNLNRIQIAAASNLNTLNIIGGGTFSSSSSQVFTIYRNLTINSDGATNIVSTATNGILFQPLLNTAGTTFTVNNVKSVGVYFGFTRNGNSQHYTTLNNCHVDLTNSTSGASIINYKRVTANNCTFKHTGGSITYPQNTAFPTVIEDEAFIFNNCTTVGNYGRCMLRLNNCSITTITTTNSGIYQVTLEANNTSFRNITTGSPSNLQGFAIMASTELVILKNCTINSDWGGVYLSGVSSVIDGCIIKSGNSWGVFRYNSGANVSNFLTIKNSTIECGNYSAVGTIYQSLGKQFDISNTTIITSGASHVCLGISTGTHARFDNLKLKNLATPANILNRADLLTENPQINTLDNLGNIVLA